MIMDYKIELKRKKETKKEKIDGKKNKKINKKNDGFLI